MGLKGNLATVNLADVFQVLSRGNSTGLLRIMAPGDTRYVEIMNGSISIVSRPGSRIMLGDLLRSRGVIDDAGIEQGLAHQKETGTLLGQALVDMGLVKREDIEAALRFQVEEEICDLFTIKAGEFDFLANARVDSKMALGGGFIRLKIDPNNILLEAARRMDEWPAIEERVPGPGALFRLTPKGLTVLESPEVEEELKILLKLVGEDRTFEALVQKACLGRFTTGKILAGLADDGVIEPQSKDRYIALGRLHLTEGRVDEAERVLNFAQSHLADSLEPEQKSDLSAAIAELGKRKAAATQDLTGKTRSEVVRRQASGVARQYAGRPPALYAGIAVAIVAAIGAGVYFAFFREKQPVVDPAAQADQRLSEIIMRIREEANKKSFPEAAKLLKEFAPESEKQRQLIQEEVDSLRRSANLAARADAEEGRNLLKNNKKEQAVELCKAVEKRYQGIEIEANERKELDQFVAKVRASLKEAAADKAQKILDEIGAREAANVIEAREAYRKALAEGVPDEVKARIQERIDRIDGMIAEAVKRLDRAAEHEKSGQDELAQAEYEAISRTLPGTPPAADAAAKLRELLRRTASARQAFDAAAALAAQGKTDEAIQALEQFIEKHPASSLVVRAKASLAVLKTARDDIKSLFDRAQQLEKDGDVAGARERYMQILQKYPTSEVAAKIVLPFEVRSVPDKAEVEVDGKAAGTTPVVVRLSAQEKHSIRVSRPGYKAEELKEINLRQPIISVNLSKEIEATIRLPGDIVGRPVVLAGTAYSVHDMDLVAVGGERPTVLWRKTLGENPAGGRDGMQPPLAYPFAADEALYVCTGQGKILRVDPKTGEGTPDMTLRGRMVADPLVFETTLVRDRKFLVALTTIGVECFDLSSKQVKFVTEVRRFLNASPPSPNVMPQGNSLLFGWYDANLYCVDFVGGRVAWNVAADVTAFLRVHATQESATVLSTSGVLASFSLKDGARLGRRDLSSSFLAAPVPFGDTLVIANADGAVTALSPDLRPKWSVSAEGRLECPLAADADIVYAATQPGLVWAISRNGQSLWKLKVESEPLQLAPLGQRLLVYTRGGTAYVTRTGEK